jgi:hypothetical protein
LQLLPLRKVTDAIALKNPRPDRVEPIDVPVGVPYITLTYIPTKASGQVGFVTVVT